MSPSCLDIVINRNVQNAMNPSTITEMSSDHNPLILDLVDQPKEGMKKFITCFRDTDWTDFRHTLDEKIIINNKIKTAEDIDREVKLFTKHLNETKTAHCKRIEIDQNEIRLDDETQLLIQVRNRTRKLYQRTLWQHLKPNINRLNRLIRNKIRSCYTEKWENTLENVKPGDRTLWRISKGLKNTKVQIPTLVKDDRNYSTDKEKAELIGTTLETIQTNHQQSCLENEVTAKIQELFAKDQENKTKLTNPAELRTIIRKLPNNKAAGHDNIGNKIIKNLSTKAIVQLMYILNAIIRTGYFPQSWKLAIIIPLPKPNKDKANPVNYRPNKSIDQSIQNSRKSDTGKNKQV